MVSRLPAVFVATRAASALGGCSALRLRLGARGLGEGGSSAGGPAAGGGGEGLVRTAGDLLSEASEVGAERCRWRSRGAQSAILDRGGALEMCSEKINCLERRPLDQHPRSLKRP